MTRDSHWFQGFGQTKEDVVRSQLQQHNQSFDSTIALQPLILAVLFELGFFIVVFWHVGEIQDGKSLAIVHTQCL